MSTKERKPRGPRTPSERAQDAGRKAATLLEDVPPCPQREYYLEPIATLLRYYFGSASERRQQEAEQAFGDLVGRLRDGWRKWGDNAELFQRSGGLSNAELLEELTGDLHELVRRLNNYRETCGDVDQGTSDEGLVFAAKADALLSWARGEAYAVQHKLQRYGWQRG